MFISPARKPATPRLSSFSGVTIRESWETRRLTVMDDLTKSESSDTTGIPASTREDAIEEPSAFPLTSMATWSQVMPLS